jgi:hypothetical protein
MKLALETEIRFRISLSIGDSRQLEPMTRRVRSETLRLLNAGGAAVYARSGELLERSARFSLLRSRWPSPADVAAQGWRTWNWMASTPPD